MNLYINVILYRCLLFQCFYLKLLLSLFFIHWTFYCSASSLAHYMIAQNIFFYCRELYRLFICYIIYLYIFYYLLQFCYFISWCESYMIAAVVCYMLQYYAHFIFIFLQHLQDYLSILIIKNAALAASILYLVVYICIPFYVKKCIACAIS